MDKKKKGALSPPQSELHFTTSIPIETASAILASLANPQVNVELTLLNDGDALDFKLERLHQGAPNAIVKGRLRRWQGTLTRVDCDGHGADSVLRSDFALQIGFTLGMITLTIASIAYAIVSGRIIVYDWNGALVWFMTPITVVAVLSYWGAHQALTNIYAQREYQTKRDLDKLMQQLVESLNDGTNELVER